jgi:hypothetical protein
MPEPQPAEPQVTQWLVTITASAEVIPGDPAEPENGEGE